jgi:hypothetical protein
VTFCHVVIAFALTRLNHQADSHSIKRQFSPTVMQLILLDKPVFIEPCLKMPTIVNSGTRNWERVNVKFYVSSARQRLVTVWECNFV